MTSAPLPAAKGDLTSRQAALVAGAELPAGFDPTRVSAARRALLVKRAKQVATTWPLLAASFGADWAERFTTWAQDHAPVGPLRDGWDFARALDGAGELPELAVTELAERETRWHYDGRSTPRKRWLRWRTLLHRTRS